MVETVFWVMWVRKWEVIAVWCVVDLVWLRRNPYVCVCVCMSGMPHASRETVGGGDRVCEVWKGWCMGSGGNAFA